MDVNLQGPSSITPLGLAVLSHRDGKMIEILLNAHADPNQGFLAGKQLPGYQVQVSPLFVALLYPVGCSSLSVIAENDPVKLLVEKKANPLASGGFDNLRSIDLLSLHSNGEAMVMRLMKAGGLRGHEIDMRALSFAVVTGNLQMVKTLVSAKANVNCHVDGHGRVIKWGTKTPKELQGHTKFGIRFPCVEAARHGHVDVVRFLVQQAGCRLKPPGIPPGQPLDLVPHIVENYDKKCPVPKVQAVIEFLVVDQKCSTDGMLHKAVLKDRPQKLVAWMLDHLNCRTHVDIDQLDDHGMTPLMCAVDVGNVELARLLVLRKADVNVTRSGERATALIMAITNSLTVPKLQMHPHRLSIEHPSTQLISCLLESHDLDVNMTNEWGETALVFAAQGSKPEAVGLLVNAKARVDALDRCNRSLLSLALQHKQARWMTKRPSCIRVHGYRFYKVPTLTGLRLSLPTPSDGMKTIKILARTMNTARPDAVNFHALLNQALWVPDLEVVEWLVGEKHIRVVPDHIEYVARKVTDDGAIAVSEQIDVLRYLLEVNPLSMSWIVWTNVWERGICFAMVGRFLRDWMIARTSQVLSEVDIHTSHHHKHGDNDKHGHLNMLHHSIIQAVCGKHTTKDTTTKRARHLKRKLVNKSEDACTCTCMGNNRGKDVKELEDYSNAHATARKKFRVSKHWWVP
ncbi:hypothetical protein AAMO2058_001365600 [Amorphochlora amoebiformis]